MTRRILFTSRKGGVGKSTLARATAVALACEGRNVLLADFDTEQGTCLRWHAQRQARRLEPTIAVARFGKMAKLKRVADQYDDVVIDTRGQDHALGLELAEASDAIFLPSSFSLDDITPTLAIVEALRRAGIPPWRVAVVFCRTGESVQHRQQARSILNMNNVTALDAVLPQRDGFVALSATGRTGREAENGALVAIATAVDRAVLQFIAAAAAQEDTPVVSGLKEARAG